MSTTIIKVQGMSCGGCVKSVSNALQASAGVMQVQVDLQAGSATVEYDPAQTDPQRLAATVEEIGFGASCSN